MDRGYRVPFVTERPRKSKAGRKPHLAVHPRRKELAEGREGSVKEERLKNSPAVFTPRDRIRELRRVPASELLPNPKNWRKHPEAQQAALRAMLERVGIANAVLARELPDGRLELVDGHLRSDLLGSAEVPVLVLDVDEREADQLLATLDPLAGMAEADGAKLADLLKTFERGSSVGLDAMLQDLDRTAAISLPPVVDDAEEVPEPPAEPVSKRGNLWLLGEHRLLCGDSTDAADVARVMGCERPDCVFTSPPYGVGIEYGTYEDTIANLRAMLPTLAALWHGMLVDGGFAVVNFGDIVSGAEAAGAAGVCEYPMALEYWPVFRGAGFALWSRRAWCKPVARVAAPWCASSNRSATNFEHVWTWKKDGQPVVGRVPGPMDSKTGWFDTSRLEGVDVGKDTHGAGMPVSTAAWMLNVHSRLDAVVHEPFSGTGTTIIAAEQLRRRCFAIEIEPRYVDVAVARWEKFTGKKAQRG